MTTKMLYVFVSAICFFSQLGQTRAGAKPDGQSQVRVEPSEIDLDMFFNGTTIQVDVSVEAKSDVAVLCTGKEESLKLNKKGKVLGLLWMNTGEVDFKKVPTIYQLTTSNKVEKLAQLDVRRKLGLGYSVLAEKVIEDANDQEQQRLFREMVKLKESEGLFSVAEGSIELQSQASLVHATTRFRLPAKTPPGDYEVRVFGFKDGTAALLGSKRLSLRRAGATALVTSLAQEHGLLYGIFAVIIALVVGLLTGLVFGLGSKKGH